MAIYAVFVPQFGLCYNLWYKFIRSFLPFKFVLEIYLSQVGQNIQRTCSPSLDILNSAQTFCCKISSEYQTSCWTSVCWTLYLICPCRTFYPGRSNPFAGHFQNHMLSKISWYTCKMCGLPQNCHSIIC